MKHETYNATVELGIPVQLINAVTEDQEGIDIPRLEMLLASVAVARVLAPVQLSGAELRFLRHVLGYTGSEFAAAIDLSDKTAVSRWESGEARPGAYTEKVIRQLVLNLLGKNAPGIEIGKNAIPGMRIRMADQTRPMAFAFGRRKGPARRTTTWHMVDPGEVEGANSPTGP